MQTAGVCTGRTLCCQDCGTSGPLPGSEAVPYTFLPRFPFSCRQKRQGVDRRTDKVAKRRGKGYTSREKEKSEGNRRDACGESGVFAGGDHAGFSADDRRHVVQAHGAFFRGVYQRRECLCVSDCSPGQSVCSALRCGDPQCMGYRVCPVLRRRDGSEYSSRPAHRAPDGEGRGSGRVCAGKLPFICVSSRHGLYGKPVRGSLDGLSDDGWIGADLQYRGGPDPVFSQTGRRQNAEGAVRQGPERGCDQPDHSGDCLWLHRIPASVFHAAHFIQSPERYRKNCDAAGTDGHGRAG